MAVLELVADGYSNKEIAERLGIERKTIGSHLRNLFQKLHVDNRTQAAAVMWRMRLECAQAEREELRALIASMQPEFKALLFYMVRAVKLFSSLAEDGD